MQFGCSILRVIFPSSSWFIVLPSWYIDMVVKITKNFNSSVTLNIKVMVGRAPAGRAFRFKSSPLVPRGCGLSTPIPHANVNLELT